MTEKEHPILTGHSIIGNKRLRNVEDVARFICKHGQYGDVTVTCEGKGIFITTCGIFLDRIADMDYRARLMPVLTKMQEEMLSESDEQEETADQSLKQELQ